jgi:RNA polymerase sigma factor (sigma-70 family)
LFPDPAEVDRESGHLIAPSNSQEQVHALYSSHHRWLHAWLRSRLGCSHSAADVAHDTFVRIMTSRDALFGMREPRAYLTTTAKRLLVDRARRQAIEDAWLAEAARSGLAAGHAPSPEETLIAIEALVQISTALDGAPTRVRESFLLHDLEELTHAAIARRLGVSDRMVRKYLVQALLHCSHLPGRAADAR